MMLAGLQCLYPSQFHSNLVAVYSLQWTHALEIMPPESFITASLFLSSRRKSQVLRLWIGFTMNLMNYTGTPPHMSESIRVQGELYSLPLFLDAHQDLQDSPGEPSCTLPWVEVTLMFSSDLTHLTAFGDVKLWPLYLFFGNNSKYLHCKPMSHLCKHVAYFIKVGTSTSIITAHILIINLQLPDSFKDFASSQTAGGHTPTTAFTTHCTRELMHEQWKILLDDTSLEAWEHGIVIMCLDGLLWWFYPWIFTYSADYPEKWVTKANIITTYNYSFF